MKLPIEVNGKAEFYMLKENKEEPEPEPENIEETEEQPSKNEPELKISG